MASEPRGKTQYGPPPAGGSGANVDVDTDGVLEAVNFFAMVQGEARKGRWSIFGDFVYVDFGTQESQVRSVDFNPGPGPVNVTTSQLNSGTQSALDATVFTLAGGYNMVQDPTTTLDLIAGVRYANVKARTDWNLTAVVTGPAGAAAFAPPAPSNDRTISSTASSVRGAAWDSETARGSSRITSTSVPAPPTLPGRERSVWDTDSGGAMWCFRTSTSTTILATISSYKSSNWVASR